MAQVSIGAAIESGFRLIGRRPLAVLGWGLLHALILLVTVALFAPIYAAIIQASALGQNPAAAMQSMNGQFLQMQALSYLLDIGEIGVSSVVYCAIWRSVIHPDQAKFAYLRAGAPELFLGILTIGAAFAFFMGFFVFAVVVGVVIGVLVVSHAGLAAAILGVIAIFGALIAMVYVALRFSLAGPMMVADGKFHLGESWTLTRGHVGALFMVALTLMVVLIAIEIVFVILLFAIGLGAVSALAGGLQNLATWAQQPGMLGRLAPLLLVFAALWIPLSGAMAAVIGAPWASAYLDLKPKEDVAALFA
ncbi:MAG TPA: hypothetical protein VJP88_08470 [Caulobacteraceae bacterium]|nr:hypothetical protein [Caulobacteraceae bacterium]